MVNLSSKTTPYFNIPVLICTKISNKNKANKAYAILEPR